jgi:hypothetical protein
MSISWNFYIKRRRINVEKFVKSKKCKTYDEFCNVLNLHDITPPLEKEVSEYFIKPSPKPRVRPPQKAKSLNKPLLEKQIKDIKPKPKVKKSSKSVI